ncbi:hypothetical protein Bca4012_095230 [Brassica carinata]|uniref:Uncharacterized protein n=2 Tax=Brassica TaxID=3705 RepID=A0A0D3DT18_BRAOL|nr:unnamed protein product [Brassica napus]CAF2111739.1 unnamed protein product [Brassica napus]
MRSSSSMPSAHLIYALSVTIMATLVAAYEPYTYSLPPLPSYSPSPKVEYNTPPLLLYPQFSTTSVLFSITKDRLQISSNTIYLQFLTNTTIFLPINKD